MTTNININNQIACISNNYVMGILISQYFIYNNKYFPIFNLINVSEKVSFVGGINFEKQLIFIKNSLIKTTIKKIILAGLNEYQKNVLIEEFEERFEIILVDKIEEIDEKLRIFKNFSGSFYCQKEHLKKGLIYSSRTNKKMILSTQSNFCLDQKDSKDIVTIIEENNDLNDVAALNFSLAIDAEIYFVEKINFNNCLNIKRGLLRACNDNDKKRKKRITNIIKKRIQNIDFNKYKFATFFTNGLPYGYAIKNIIPNSHVYTRGADRFIFDNIYFENSRNSFNIACLFHPSCFNGNEVRDIKRSLVDNNYYVKVIDNENATSNNLSNHLQYYPFDIFHICSHGGEIKGYFIIIYIKDKKGVNHELQYYETQNISITDRKNENGEPLFACTKSIFFKKMDGIDIGPFSKEGQKIDKDASEALEAALKDGTLFNGNNEKIRIPTNFDIPNSSHIFCYDGLHLGGYHILAGQSTPFIFNNTCDSWFDMSYKMISAGARAYVGTLFNIGDQTAENSAIQFYKNLEEPLIEKVFNINKGIKNNKYKNIYIFWGLHFSKLYKPDNNDIEDGYKLYNYFYSQINNYLEKYLTKDNEYGVKDNSMEAARFLYDVYKKDFGVELLSFSSYIKDNTKSNNESEDFVQGNVLNTERKLLF